MFVVPRRFSRAPSARLVDPFTLLARGSNERTKSLACHSQKDLTWKSKHCGSPVLFSQPKKKPPFRVINLNTPREKRGLTTDALLRRALPGTLVKKLKILHAVKVSELLSPSFFYFRPI
jgi:hypothetical protein